MQSNTIIIEYLICLKDCDFTISFFKVIDFTISFFKVSGFTMI